MDGLAWLASRHTWLVHLPAAAALMIPLPIIAAQRAGRGIRPWWITCRYLAWAGCLGALLAVVSGLLAARNLGWLAHDGLWPIPQAGMARLFWIHQLGGLACLALGIACLRSLYHTRQDHQGIGIAALLLGLLWGASAMATAYAGPYLLGRAEPPAYLTGSSPVR